MKTELLLDSNGNSVRVLRVTPELCALLGKIDDAVDTARDFAKYLDEKGMAKEYRATAMVVSVLLRECTPPPVLTRAGKIIALANAKVDNAMDCSPAQALHGLIVEGCMGLNDFTDKELDEAMEAWNLDPTTGEDKGN